MIHIALIRGINLGGKTMLAMADLRATCEKLRFKNPRTLMQSGNLVVESPESPAEMEHRLEQGMKKHLGRELEFFVRSPKEWDAIIKANPFPREAKVDPGRLVLLCLKEKVTTAAVKDLQKKIPGRESVEAWGREAYAYYPDGQGESKFTSTLIDRTLATRCTARNWNTVLKLAAMANGV
ncbi:MAG TPA: DUF1697 domain-containing protein [Gemmatimonadales bacterium]|nr:DUF1697 domain-containing protein [Gemmatimonadales bacterium]